MRQLRHKSNAAYRQLLQQLADPARESFANQTCHHDAGSTIGRALESILDGYPPVQYAFGYGSKVFPQGAGSEISNSQIDMMLVVDDSRQFHQQNIARHRDDYSSLALLGPSVVDRVGRLGAGVYFNPFVQVRPHGTPMELKYGVTSTETLVRDLTHWDSLYLAGRLHKPVAVLVDNPRVALAQQVNLTNAARMALLLQKQARIGKDQLFRAIAGLSYLGDPRLMVNGENPNKVVNIVNNQHDQFDRLYMPILEQYLDDYVCVSGDELVLNQSVMSELVDDLPPRFTHLLSAGSYAYAIKRTVFWPALQQSLKGVLTAGIVRSWKYAAAKRAKFNKAK